MNTENLLFSGRKLFLFIGQFIVLLLCIWYIEFIYYTNIYPDKIVNDTYEQTDCTIINKVLSERHKLIHGYRADFLVNYGVGNMSYTQWVSGNGLDRSFTSNRVSQETLLSQFDIGVTYPCWYDPKVPQVVVIVLRHNWASTVPLLVPSFVALVMIYYLGKNIFDFLGETTIKVRERKRAKKKKE